MTSLNLAIEDVTNNVTPTMQNPGDHDGIDNVFLGVPSVVPEPGSLMLAGSGLACLLAARVPRGKRDRPATGPLAKKTGIFYLFMNE